MRKLFLRILAISLACTATAVRAEEGPTGNAARLQRLVEITEKPWAQLLAQNALDLKPGEMYRLTFWAKASQALTLRVLIKMDRPPWTGLQEQKLDLGTSWEPLEVLLQADTADPGHTRLEFRYAGTEAGDIWIADVQLRPDADTSAPNMIQNSRFEEKLKNWYTEGLRPEAFVIQVEPAQAPAKP